MSEAKRQAPRIYAAISSITSDLARCGIAKNQVNTSEGYRFRGIDDVMLALAPLLARHRVCVLPRILEREAKMRKGANNSVLVHVCLKVAFDMVSARDGSSHSIEVTSEALDGGDKATGKAMSAAWKQAMIQAFCIPAGQADAETDTLCLQQFKSGQADPVEGWEQWSADLCELISNCTSDEAVQRVQSTYHAQLRSLSRRKPEIFADIGRAITQKRESLAGLMGQRRQAVNQSGA